MRYDIHCFQYCGFCGCVLIVHRSVCIFAGDLWQGMIHIRVRIHIHIMKVDGIRTEYEIIEE